MKEGKDERGAEQVKISEEKLSAGERVSNIIQ